MPQRAAFRIGYRRGFDIFSNEAIADAVEATVRRMAGVFGERIEETVKEITENAEKQWPRGPRKDGKNAPNKRQPYHSQDTFVYGLRIRGDYLEGYIDNYATNIRGQPYWFFIKTMQGGLRLADTVRKSKIVALNPETNQRVEPGSPINAYVKKPLKRAAERIVIELGDDLRAMMRGTGGTRGD